MPRGETRSRAERAREWKLTALTALVVALAIFGWAATASPAWDRGDVITGLYFGLLSVCIWVQAIRIEFATAAPTFSHITRILLQASFTIGLLLAATDIASAGRF